MTPKYVNRRKITRVMRKTGSIAKNDFHQGTMRDHRSCCGASSVTDVTSACASAEGLSCVCIEEVAPVIAFHNNLPWREQSYTVHKRTISLYSILQCHERLLQPVIVKCA